MGKKDKGKRKKRRQKQTTSLEQHKRVGKKLIPPMRQLQQMSLQSWMNDRMPEMLWACLVISVLPRGQALDAFRRIAQLGFKYRERNEARGWNLYHTTIASLPAEIVQHVVMTVTRHPLGYAALRPLLLLDGLPGREMWRAALNVEVQDSDWTTLGRAVGTVLDHQSQESTDVRWLTVLFKMALGALHFPQQLIERAREIVEYPNRGDMRGVRPSIRAMEMTFNQELDAEHRWSKQFWRECFQKTRCEPVVIPRDTGKEYDRVASIKHTLQAHEQLLGHWFSTLETTDVDAKHDAAFGFGFYTLSALLEMTVGRNGIGITGRVLLRTLVECRITLAYLRKANDPELWKRFRAFGTGQAKLAFLKLDDIGKKKPRFVTPSVLESLANEDVFQEYVDIDLGHWCDLDLRRMAELSETKGDYDKVYGWASTFVHGHWPALRDTCMTHCLNPLHRLHRIPLPSHRTLEDAVYDGVELVNRVLGDINAMYPGFRARARIVRPTKEKGNQGEEGAAPGVTTEPATRK